MVLTVVCQGNDICLWHFAVHE